MLDDGIKHGTVFDNGGVCGDRDGSASTGGATDCHYSVHHRHVPGAAGPDAYLRISLIYV